MVASSRGAVVTSYAGPPGLSGGQGTGSESALFTFGVDMSADKDRGIRRQKQKRAKAAKKSEKPTKKPAGKEPATRSAG
jgi:hypothetical protein